ncbi:MAG: twin-arginine translocase TatA/TatE family subunit [Planctomycetota bacterium]|nr:twin-arginine translocase TatA/TatE family subunit [Planctomycetota bacterium]
MIESTLLLPANLAIGLPGPTEMIVLLVIGLLIFGRRLPEVGRSIGRSIVEFKRGVKGIEDEVENQSETPAQLDDQSVARGDSGVQDAMGKVMPESDVPSQGNG